MEAEFRSKCPTCGGWIEVGDKIEYDDFAEDWVHEECKE